MIGLKKSRSVTRYYSHSQPNEIRGNLPQVLLERA